MNPEIEPPVRVRCPACRLAAQACWCAHVPVLAPRAHVMLLQHPREARNPMGTARMAHRALPGSELLVGLDFAADPRVLRRLAVPGSVVLYPAPGARPLAELAAHPDPLTLWVIDGTWWQAHKLWLLNPWLATLPAYRIDPAEPSRYLIRSEPAAHCLSTVEAVAAALDASEAAPGRHDGMLAPLDALVARQLGHAQAGGRAPRRRRRAPRALYLPELLRGRAGDALLVHGEGSAWPAALVPRPPSELAQWVAVRPSTGERFGLVVQPASGVSPKTEQYLGLGAADFASAASHAELAARWQGFVRPGDVWCAWGHMPASLLAAAGPTPPHIVDLRAWAHRWLRARPGRIEAAHAEVAGTAEPPRYPGRGGKRLAMLEAIFARLTSSSPPWPA